MNSRNPKGDTNILPVSWWIIGYAIERDRADGGGDGEVGHRNFTIDEVEKRRMAIIAAHEKLQPRGITNAYVSLLDRNRKSYGRGLIERQGIEEGDKVDHLDVNKP
ncbi:hypothetical protein EVAR_65449_1 [Eumeta japonica]|uniref:Uncharacterized protein n=1 Tax=Eumeta variegata TaxID=151549 RepID=A0A4C1ZFG0_EUMVA|nr:hypothetical protein EVAR_65449_1 [Eumeta japonica]